MNVLNYSIKYSLKDMTCKKKDIAEEKERLWMKGKC